ncbi:Panacea domain-containing protein [Kutzneria sp. NPDC052558]|uniref:Panacea domain-containing protein n=1 Tax=Kutzneria sp. NPDC052558 TaxID=3364121 RepID=UPI0037C776F9
MARAVDVAAYILAERGPMTAMKLQKLVYYCQAWHLVWEEKPLFDEQIEAWANGPVVPDLYRRHRGRLNLTERDALGGDPKSLTTDELDTIDSVLGYYGDRSAHWLSELTHREGPWRCTRDGARLGDGERGSAVISHSDMFEYYDGLTAAEQAE